MSILDIFKFEKKTKTWPGHVFTVLLFIFFFSNINKQASSFYIYQFHQKLVEFSLISQLGTIQTVFQDCFDQFYQNSLKANGVHECFFTETIDTISNDPTITSYHETL